MKNKIIIAANTGFALYNFRLSFMKHLMTKGLDVAAMACDEADYAVKFSDQGIRFIDVAMDHKGINPVNDMRLITDLVRIYRREKPYIVHHFTIKPVIFGSMAAKMAGVPNIVNTITGLGYVFETGGWIETLTRRLYMVALRGRPRVIFQNSDNYNLFIRKKMTTPEQASVIPGSGVDTSSLQPGAHRGAGKSPTFLLASRMLWSKGVREFVDAAEKIKKDCPEAKFIMAGGVSGGGAVGNPQAVPEDWLLNVNQHGVVQWVGRIPFEQVLDLMDKAEVVVLPSYGEGLPKSLIEAASKAKAIITTDAPGCRDIVQDGVNGFLVPPRDADALAEKMRYFIDRPDQAEAMGLAGRKRAVDLFDEKIVFEKTLDIYQSGTCNS